MNDWTHPTGKAPKNVVLVCLGASHQTYIDGAFERDTPDWLRAQKDPTRRENYTSGRLPAGVLYLTAGIDCQDDRLELEIVGWRQASRDEPPESWGVEYQVLRGDPARTAVWEQLDGILKQEWRVEDGRVLRISAACVDSGGHHTAQVYAFCTERKGRHIYAVKGLAGARPVWSHKAGKSKKYQAQVWHVGSDTAKDAWYARLRIKEFGPGYCHFPLAYTEEYFDMLTSEQVRTKYSKGRPVREYFLPPGRRNEALDIRVYALAALLARPVNWTALAQSPPSVSTPAPKAPQAGGFINRPTARPGNRGLRGGEMLHWLRAIAHENYSIHYWDAVAKNEWWLRLMTELTEDKE